MKTIELLSFGFNIAFYMPYKDFFFLEPQRENAETRNISTETFLQERNTNYFAVIRLGLNQSFFVPTFLINMLQIIG